MPENTVRFMTTTSPSLIKASSFDIIKEKPLKPQQYLEEFALQVQRSILREAERTSSSLSLFLRTSFLSRWKPVEVTLRRSQFLAQGSFPSGSVLVLGFENLLDLSNQFGPATFNHANGSHLLCSSRLASKRFSAGLKSGFVLAQQGC